jgi:hypothetical protein
MKTKFFLLFFFFLKGWGRRGGCRGDHIEGKAKDEKVINHLSQMATIGVVDPDPYIHGPPGSGSVIISTDPDPSII